MVKDWLTKRFPVPGNAGQRRCGVLHPRHFRNPTPGMAAMPRGGGVAGLAGWARACSQLALGALMVSLSDYEGRH